jgi:hypothetical protein
MQNFAPWGFSAEQFWQRMGLSRTKQLALLVSPGVARGQRAAEDELGSRFDSIYARSRRQSIPPKKPLRALLLQVLYTARRERMLMEQLDYNFLFRWFVGVNIDDPVWDVTVFTRNRERLLAGEVARAFFNAVATIVKSLYESRAITRPLRILRASQPA